MKLIIKPITLIVFISLYSVSIFSQSSVKGFKSFDKGEYEKAIETFKKHIEDDTSSCAAYFGLALSYSVNEFSGKDYFKAWDYFVKAKNNFDKLTEDERIFFKEFFTARDVRRRSQTTRYNFDFEEKELDSKLIKFVREENNIELAEKFIRVYPKSKYFENVVHIRNHIKYRLAEKANTMDAYANFIKLYPDAAQVPKAVYALNKLAFDNAKMLNTVASYSKYMTNYPASDQYFEALRLRDQLAFDQARKTNTIEAIESFISNYPKALQLMNARTILRKLLYDRAKQINTLEAYNEFISKYPDGEFYIDIFNLKSSVLGQKIIATIEGSKEAVVWAKGFDYDGRADISGGIAIAQDGKSYIAGTRNKTGDDGTETWLISLAPDGKVLWNKPFGTKIYNEANFLNITPQNELLISGWAGVTKDSADRKTWIFKLGLNGNGLWEKTLEGNEPKALIYSPDNEIYMSGYQLDDSLKFHNFLIKLNSDAKKMWSRSYLKKGSLEGITLNSKNEIACASGQWTWKLDKQGYIIWEKNVLAGDSLFSAAYNGTQFFLSGNRKGLPVILKINESGMPAGEIPLNSTEPSKIIMCQPLPNKQILLLQAFNENIKLKVLDEKGLEIKSITISNAQVTGPGTITTSVSGDIYLNFTSFSQSVSGDIVVMKINFNK